MAEPTQPCRHCGLEVYEGTYAQRKYGPTVEGVQLVAGTITWRHYLNGLASCQTMLPHQWPSLSGEMLSR